MRFKVALCFRNDHISEKSVPCQKMEHNYASNRSLSQNGSENMVGLIRSMSRSVNDALPKVIFPGTRILKSSDDNYSSSLDGWIDRPKYSSRISEKSFSRKKTVAAFTSQIRV